MRRHLINKEPSPVSDSPALVRTNFTLALPCRDFKKKFPPQASFPRTELDRGSSWTPPTPTPWPAPVHLLNNFGQIPQSLEGNSCLRGTISPVNTNKVLFICFTDVIQGSRAGPFDVSPEISLTSSVFPKRVYGILTVTCRFSMWNIAGPRGLDSGTLRKRIR